MRIGIMSDSHGNLFAVDKALSRIGKVDALLHAGDFGADFRELPLPFPVYLVRGNCDWDTFDVPSELIITLAEEKILLTHGHQYDIKVRLSKLEKTAVQEGVKVVVFGHSHVPFIERRNGILYLNPGSVARPRGGSVASCAVLAMDEGNIDAEILPI